MKSCRIAQANLDWYLSKSDWRFDATKLIIKVLFEVSIQFIKFLLCNCSSDLSLSASFDFKDTFFLSNSLVFFRFYDLFVFQFSFDFIIKLVLVEFFINSIVFIIAKVTKILVRYLLIDGLLLNRTRTWSWVYRPCFYPFEIISLLEAFWVFIKYVSFWRKLALDWRLVWRFVE
jgi:hypothetical protein